MQRKELAKYSDFDLVSLMAEHLEVLKTDDETSFWLDAEEMVQYRQRLSPRIRNKLITLILKDKESQSPADADG